MFPVSAQWAPVKDCKMKECGIDGCQKRHNRLLHRTDNHQNPSKTSTETVETHASVGLKNFGILPVNKVELSNCGYKSKVLALIDSGSSLSWINKSVADQLCLQGLKQNLSVSGINGIENHESELVQVAINTEDHGKQNVQMAIHRNLVIGDSN